MEITSELAQIMSEIAVRKEIVIKQLSQSPKCDLLRSFNNGKPAVFEVTHTKEGKRVRKTITGDKDRQLAIAKRYALEYELGKLRKTELILQDALSMAADVGELGAQRFLMTTYDWIHKEDAEKLCFGDSAADAWAAAPYEQTDYLADQRRIVTSTGLYVRSKSEALIAETLEKYHIPSRYEQVLNVGGALLVPDFTIRRGDGRLFYWEHEGLTNSRQYLTRQRRKEELYAGVGIVPWKNLIVTYDNEDGCIDLRIVEAEIRSKLLL